MISYKVDPGGVAILTFDLENHPTNVLTGDTIRAFGDSARRAIADPGVVGVVVLSAKRDFIVGADLRKILPIGVERREYTSTIEGFHRIWRDIETGGKPFVAAINGSALGGGYELSLACHHRTAADNSSTRIGLPETTLGLIPGGGGTQRLPRLVGIAASLPIIVEGRTVNVAEAARIGMVDEVVSPDQLLERAIAWVRKAAPADAIQPWDRTGDGSGTVDDPDADKLFADAGDKLLARTRGLQHGPERALAAMREGFGLPFDEAIAVETRHFVDSCYDPQANNIIRTSFFGLNAARKLAFRPEGVEQRSFRKIGVLGAGMMGSGIAQVAAAAGFDVVLLDSSRELAGAARDRVRKNLQHRIDRGALSEAQADGIVARIDPTADYRDLAPADLVIEAVFEDRSVKAEVTQRAVAVAGDDSVFASNTSTLPITGLAEASVRPGRF
ncbi:MAG: 3-hydroxyacyl-CoA dehydrogenase NAD-binding domain-containing protein, partial [Pseudomonadota bacterium]|nr:3-hydroxyacyl-CoA dehydrogenase NAD-binding domain-containing protein [Pseudomonadota bacterium]